MSSRETSQENNPENDSEVSGIVLMKCVPMMIPVIFSFVRCTNSRLKLEDYKSKLLQLVALSYKPPQPPSQHVTDSISVSNGSYGTHKVAMCLIKAFSYKVSAQCLTYALHVLCNQEVFHCQYCCLFSVCR